jgi:FtsP/CotA-like multicopper oxidase with cupredoxin domain
MMGNEVNQEMSHQDGDDDHHANDKYSKVFDQNTEGLPEVKKTEIVELKDGDVYEMEAYAVKQEVGNRKIKRLSYNGMIPGPILKIQKGAKITLRFKNSLEIPTTLHSHGLRLADSKFDGLPDTMGGEQKEMQPGEVFEYKLNFPDAGIF